MKIATAALIIFCFSQCSGFKNDPVKSTIQGIYVSCYGNEFSKGKDTLLITALSSEGNNYRIYRSVTYQRIKNGVLLGKERRQEQWSCIYKESDKVLYEVTKGKIISFIPERDLLLVGNTEYLKTGNSHKVFKISN
jgi:hypothetical protein